MSVQNCVLQYGNRYENVMIWISYVTKFFAPTPKWTLLCDISVATRCAREWNIYIKKLKTMLLFPWPQHFHFAQASIPLLFFVSFYIAKKPSSYHLGYYVRNCLKSPKVTFIDRNSNWFTFLENLHRIFKSAISLESKRHTFHSMCSSNFIFISLFIKKNAPVSVI